MYGKIFASMYEGTLYGKWEAIVTFQQLIVLCTPDGVVDMTPAAIAARTSIPLDVIEKGLVVLEAPDPHSRTPDLDGRRLERLDAHRPWGWRIVNHEKYRDLVDAETVREQTRVRVQRHRLSQTLQGSLPGTVTDGNASNAPLRYTDSDAYSGGGLTSSSPEGRKLPLIPVCGKPGREGGFEWPVPLDFLAELEAAFPKVDGPATLLEIRAWCVANPTRRKTLRGVRRFIFSWFEREQNRPEGRRGS